ncbi:hypothetical protein Tco_0434326 [Tanacetum coccineum]
MSSISEDIQCASSDTRPLMLDRTDFESWQQRIHLYCLGKDNRENMMKSINKGPFHMGTVSDVIVGGTEGAVQQGPVRARVLNDLLAEEKESLITFWDNVKMILEGGLKESNFDQLYAYLKQHEVHANENRMMMERFIQPTDDPLALVSNASNQKYPTQSSESPQSSNQPSIVDNCQMDTGSTSTDNLIESLTNTLALLNQSFKANLPQTNNQLRTSSNARNNATVQDDKVVVQDVRAIPLCATTARNRAHSRDVTPKRPQDSDYFKDKMLLMHAHENGDVLDEEQLLFLAGEQVTNFDEDVDDLALNVDHVFETDQCDAFDSDVDEAPTTQTMFMAKCHPEDQSTMKPGII